MRTREIAHDRWQCFFDDFTQLYKGEHVNVETMGASGSKVRAELCDLPLVGIVDAGSKSESQEWIEVVAGDSPDRQASHLVAQPSRVVFAEEHGHAVALQIESADGVITMLRFEPPREGMPAGYTVA